MLWWSEPRWISDSDDVYAARYKWYKNTLDAAYDTYGIKFDYVSATQNERGRDNGWIVYLLQHLKSEPDSRYDYSAIKIVAGEEVCTWQAAAEVLKGLRDGDATLSGQHRRSRKPLHQQLHRPCAGTCTGVRQGTVVQRGKLSDGVLRGRVAV